MSFTAPDSWKKPLPPEILRALQAQIRDQAEAEWIAVGKQGAANHVEWHRLTKHTIGGCLYGSACPYLTSEGETA